MDNNRFILRIIPIAILILFLLILINCQPKSKDVIVIKNNSKDEIFVLDTKWKRPIENDIIVPKDADLHQMYVYLDIYGDKNSDNKAKKVALVYPGHDEIVKGVFVNTKTSAECDMIFLPGKDSPTEKDDNKEFISWQNKMVDKIKEWIKPKK